MCFKVADTEAKEQKPEREDDGTGVHGLQALLVMQLSGSSP
jgi:hypothetical protein